MEETYCRRKDQYTGTNSKRDPIENEMGEKREQETTEHDIASNIQLQQQVQLPHCPLGSVQGASPRAGSCQGGPLARAGPHAQHCSVASSFSPCTPQQFDTGGPPGRCGPMNSFLWKGGFYQLLLVHPVVTSLVTEKPQPCPLHQGLDSPREGGCF